MNKIEFTLTVTLIVSVTLAMVFSCFYFHFPKKGSKGEKKATIRKKFNKQLTLNFIPVPSDMVMHICRTMSLDTEDMADLAMIEYQANRKKVPLYHFVKDVAEKFEEVESHIYKMIRGFILDNNVLDLLDYIFINPSLYDTVGVKPEELEVIENYPPEEHWRTYYPNFMEALTNQASFRSFRNKKDPLLVYLKQETSYELLDLMSKEVKMPIEVIERISLFSEFDLRYSMKEKYVFCFTKGLVNNLMRLGLLIILYLSFVNMFTTFSLKRDILLILILFIVIVLGFPIDELLNYWMSISLMNSGENWCLIRYLYAAKFFKEYEIGKKYYVLGQNIGNKLHIVLTDVILEGYDVLSVRQITDYDEVVREKKNFWNTGYNFWLFLSNVKRCDGGGVNTPYTVSYFEDHEFLFSDWQFVPKGNVTSFNKFQTILMLSIEEMMGLHIMFDDNVMHVKESVSANKYRMLEYLSVGMYRKYKIYTRKQFNKRAVKQLEKLESIFEKIADDLSLGYTDGFVNLENFDDQYYLNSEQVVETSDVKEVLFVAAKATLMNQVEVHTFTNRLRVIKAENLIKFKNAAKKKFKRKKNDTRYLRDRAKYVDSKMTKMKKEGFKELNLKYLAEEMEVENKMSKKYVAPEHILNDEIRKKLIRNSTIHLSSILSIISWEENRYAFKQLYCVLHKKRLSRGTGKITAEARGYAIRYLHQCLN